MNISLWTIIFLFIAAQGLFLGLLLISRKKMVRGNRIFLGLFVLFFSIILLFWVGFWNNLETKSAHFNFLYNPIPYLIGPFLFFYIKSFFDKFKRSDLLHFLPFLLVILYFSPFYVLNENQKIEYLQSQNFEELFWNVNFFKNKLGIAQILVFIFYSVLIGKYISKKKALINSESNLYVRKWLNILFILFSLFTFLLTVSYVIVDLYQFELTTYYIAGAFIGILIYVIGYIGLNHSKYVQALETIFSRKYKGSALDEKDAPVLISKIVNYVEYEKPFLNSNFKLADLSMAVEIPTHHISELLNSYHDKNFAELINYYRIEEAKILLVSDVYDNKKVSVIGYDVGFNSRTAFYQWFKKLTGLSPSVYQQKFKRKDS